MWKLGNIAPGQRDLLSVQIRFEWGLPRGQKESVVAVAAARNLANPTINLDEYLAFTPISVVTEHELTSAEVDSLLAVDPKLDDLFNYAQELGFQFYGTAQEKTLSDGSQSVELWLLNPDSQEVLAVIRGEESPLILKYSATAMAILDRNGGLSQDVETGAVEIWGIWLESMSTTSQLNAQATPSFGPFVHCILNCAVKKAPLWALANVRWIGPILKTWDCLKWLSSRGQDWASCLKCGNALAEVVGEGIPGFGIAVDFVKCGSDCYRDPQTHACTEDKRFCGKFQTPVIDPYEHVFVLRCNFGFWDFTPESERMCLPFDERCVNGQCIPDCTYTSQSLQSTDLSTQSGNKAICFANDAPCAAVSESTITPAGDPNAKSGPGEVLPGEVITYVVDYENEGEGIAYGVYVEDYLPPALDESTLVIENGGVYIPSTRTVVWDVGELQPDEKGSVRFQVQVPSSVVSGTGIINTATVFFPSVPEETPTNPVVSIVGTVVAHPQTIETVEGVPVAITLTGATVGGQPLSYAIESEPLNGALSGTPPAITYTPAPNFEGLDRFTFQVSNGLSTSVPADIVILVRTGTETIPPEVVATAPMGGAIDVPVFTTQVYSNTYQPFIWVGFSEPIDVATVTDETLFVQNASRQRLSGQVFYDGTTNSVRFLPAEPLDWGAVYTATVTTDIRDTSGNPLANKYEWWFRTEKQSNQVYLPVILKRH